MSGGTEAMEVRTLQELIASPNVVFCDQGWYQFGSKTKMAKKIERITGIPRAVLLDESASMRCCVAQKMAWAANRKTTRIEDRAYSLLGLFRINMPLLYGKGARAFQRLQLAILQKYPDESIFAWTPLVNDPHCVLASSPDDFEDCTRIIPDDARSQPSRYQLDTNPRRENPPRVTSWGIEIRANARRLEPRKLVFEFDQVQRFLWALTLTIAWNGRIQELPCTIILVRSGPAPYNYQRYECYRSNSVGLLKYLSRTYVVGDIETDKLFYLQFDKDVDLG